jgi:FkbM family methyltransferase
MKFLARFINKILGLIGVRLVRIEDLSTFPVGFDPGSDFSLVLIGAHNGQKTQKLVSQALHYGKVCLIEPTPYLFDALRKLYQHNERVTLLNVAVSPDPEEVVEFFYAKKSANTVRGYGDQLGSLSGQHATNHDPNFAPHISKIQVTAMTMTGLLSHLNAHSIDVLFIDTEGYDAKILLSFPFNRLLPKKILFEHKHADGTFRVGKNFASVLTLLESFGYHISIVDVENALAQLQ